MCAGFHRIRQVWIFPGREKGDRENCRILCYLEDKTRRNKQKRRQIAVLTRSGKE